MSFLVPAAQAPAQPKRGTLETVEALARAGSAVLIFGGWAIVIGGGAYLAYRGLKKIGWL